MAEAGDGNRLLALMLHPVRLRIIQQFNPERTLTAAQLARALPDVPQASLYRHLKQLAAGGVIAVVDERQVRNMTEKVYALVPATTRLDLADAARATKDELVHLFAAFAALLLSDFRHYLRHRPGDRVDLQGDGVTFWQRALYLTPEEGEELTAMLDAATASLAGHAPGPGRRRQLVSFATMPAPDAPGDQLAGPGEPDAFTPSDSHSPTAGSGGRSA